MESLKELLWRVESGVHADSEIPDFTFIAEDAQRGGTTS
jgi:hypothetical protein